MVDKTKSDNNIQTIKNDEQHKQAASHRVSINFDMTEIDDSELWVEDANLKDVKRSNDNESAMNSRLSRKMKNNDGFTIQGGSSHFQSTTGKRWPSGTYNK